MALTSRFITGVALALMAVTASAAEIRHAGSFLWVFRRLAPVRQRGCAE